MSDTSYKRRTNYAIFDMTKAEALTALFGGSFEKSTTHPADFVCYINYSDSLLLQDPEDWDEHRSDLIELMGREAYEELRKENEPGDDDVFLQHVIHHALLDTSPPLVMIELAYDKLRFLDGTSVAIDASGEVLKEVVLADIYDHLPGGTTKAHY